MDIFANNLKKRAETLGLSNAEIARRIGLSERRYAHYVSGRNEPDLALLLKIAEVLNSSVEDLLNEADRAEDMSHRDKLQQRLIAATAAMTDADLKAAVVQAEAVIKARRD